MNRKMYALLILVIGLASAMAYATNKSGASQTIKTEKSAVQKWEHCAIGFSEGIDYDSFSGRHRRYATRIHYYTGDGIKEEAVEGNKESESRAKAIAKLGDEGWEMVQQGHISSNESMVNWIYFKRAKQ